MKIKILLFVSLIICSISIFSQVAPNIYLIEFTDKNNSEFNVTQPHEFLSQRAIERRNRYNIPIHENDLPVNQTYIDSIEVVGATVRHKSKWLNSVVVDIYDLSVLNTLNSISFVKSVSKKSVNLGNGIINKFEDEEPSILNKK